MWVELILGAMFGISFGLILFVFLSSDD